MMEEIAVSNDALPSTESSISTKDNNNEEEDGAKVSDPTGTVNPAQDAFNRSTPEMSNENIHSSSHSNSITEPNIVRPDEVSLPKVKALRINDSSVTVDSPRSPNVESPNKFTQIDHSRVVVDTAAPIESVKDAVTKFGGIVDWKTHKLHTLERCRFIDQELEKTQEEMIECRKMTQATENSASEISAELERTMIQVDELELQLRSLSSQPIADDYKAQSEQELLEIVAKNQAALAELKFLKEELDSQKAVIELTAELVTEKKTFSAAQADYKQAEDQRSELIVASERDNLSWEMEMKQIEAEVDKLNQVYLSSQSLKTKLDTASALLCTLKAELESKIKQETELLSMEKEFEMVKLGIDKAAAEVSFLKGEAIALQSELEHEQDGITVIKQRRGITHAVVQSLEAELSKLNSELQQAEMKMKEASEKLERLPSKLQQAADEADQVKLQKQAVEEELRRAMEEAEEANAQLITSTTRLHAATKEKIEATMASEELAFAAMNLQQETKTVLTSGHVESANVESISSEETAGQANTRLAAALIELDAAKKYEFSTVEKLKQVSQELAVKKGEYITATEKCGIALSDKLRLEQEFRSWRTKNEQRRKANEPALSTNESAVLHPVLSPRSIKQRKDARKSGKVVATEPLHHTPGPKSDVVTDQSDSSPDPMLIRRKKRSLFPRLLMFFGIRKPHASKKLL